MPNEMAQAQPQAPAPEQAQGEGKFSSLLDQTSQGLAQMMEMVQKSSAASPEDKQNLASALQAYQAFQEGIMNDGPQAPQTQQGGVVPMEAGTQKVTQAL